MKILEIKETQRIQVFSLEVICTGNGNPPNIGKGCKSKLLVDKYDIFKTFSGAYNESSTPHATIKCINCGILTDIEDVPSEIFNELQTQKKWEKSRKNLTLQNFRKILDTIENYIPVLEAPFQIDDGRIIFNINSEHIPYESIQGKELVELGCKYDISLDCWIWI